MREAPTERRERTTPSGGDAARVVGVALVLLGCGGEPRAARDSAAAAGASAAAAAAAAAGATTGVTADTADTAVPGAADSVGATPSAVTEFLRLVETQRVTDSASVTPEATAAALRLLAAAVEALAARDSAIATATRPRLDALRARADSIPRDSLPVERARRAGEAFVLASDVLQTLQERTPPALTDREAEARQAAAAIRSDQALAAQAGAVRRFFERAAAALRGIAGTATMR
jgi:hypothetical protein